MPAGKKFNIEGIGTTRPFKSPSSVMTFVKKEHSKKRENPISIVIKDEQSEESMIFVIGAKTTFLQLLPPNLDPPYMTSSNGSDSDEPVLTFYSDSHHSEAPFFHTVKFTIGLAALHVWLNTGKLSKQIDWIEG